MTVDPTLVVEYMAGCEGPFHRFGMYPFRESGRAWRRPWGASEGFRSDGARSVYSSAQIPAY